MENGVPILCDDGGGDHDKSPASENLGLATILTNATSLYLVTKQPLSESRLSLLSLIPNLNLIPTLLDNSFSACPFIFSTKQFPFPARPPTPPSPLIPTTKSTLRSPSSGCAVFSFSSIPGVMHLNQSRADDHCTSPVALRRPKIPPNPRRVRCRACNLPLRRGSNFLENNYYLRSKRSSKTNYYLHSNISPFRYRIKWLCLTPSLVGRSPFFFFFFLSFSSA